MDKTSITVTMPISEYERLNEVEKSFIEVIKRLSKANSDLVYYEDTKLKIIEIDGKYTVYDNKYGGKARHKDMTKEWTDDFIQCVLSKRKNKLNQDMS